MIQEQLKQIDIFSSLDTDERNKLATISQSSTYSKNSIVFYEGDEPNYFYVLLEGSLKLYKTGLKNNEVVLHYFTQPTLIAEMATLESFPFPATAIAMSDNTQIAKIDKEKFLALLSEQKDFSLHIVKSLTSKIKNLELTINRNLVFDATLKVCSLLADDPATFKTLKNKDIANLLNMAPETISRILNKLKKLEIIDEDYNILSEEKLQTLLES